MGRIKNLALSGVATDVQFQVDLDDMETAMRQGHRYVSMPVVVLRVPRLLTEEVVAELRRQKVALPPVKGVNVSVLEAPGVSEHIANEWMFVSIQELEAAKAQGRDLRCAAYERTISVPVELARILLVENGLLQATPTP